MQQFHLHRKAIALVLFISDAVMLGLMSGLAACNFSEQEAGVNVACSSEHTSETQPLTWTLL